MAVRFEIIPTLATLICTASDNLTQEDVMQTKAACFALYEQVQCPIYLIFDGRHVALNFSQLMLLLAYVGHPPHNISQLPLVIYDVVDFEHPLMRLAYQALSSGQYGRLDVRPADTVQEALNHIQAAYTPSNP